MATISALKEGKTKGDITALPTDNLVRQYLKIWDHLNILDDKDATLITYDVRRILVPQSERKNLLKILHYSHAGIGKTYAAAKTRYFWPGLKAQITTMIDNCTVCKKLNQAPSSNPNIEPEIPITDLQPFESLGLDMFSWKGIQYFLVVDRLSGYVFVENMTKHASSAKVTQ